MKYADGIAKDTRLLVYRRVFDRFEKSIFNRIDKSISLRSAKRLQSENLDYTLTRFSRFRVSWSIAARSIGVCLQHVRKNRETWYDICQKELVFDPYSFSAGNLSLHRAFAFPFLFFPIRTDRKRRSIDKTVADSRKIWIDVYGIIVGISHVRFLHSTQPIFNLLRFLVNK